MKIESLTPIKGKAGRYVVELDTKESITLHEDVVVKHRLLPGKEIDHALFSQLKEEDKGAKLKHITLRYLSLRPRSSAELRSYLKRKGYGEEEIEATILLLTEEGYINDVQFAEQWIKTRMATNPRGRYLLKHELLQKGIDSSVVESALGQISSEEEFKACLQMARKKLKGYRHQASHMVKRKLYYTLTQRGFSYEIVTQVIKVLIQANDLNNQDEEDRFIIT